MHFAGCDQGAISGPKPVDLFPKGVRHGGLGMSKDMRRADSAVLVRDSLAIVGARKPLRDRR
jgi:hypothetical protein